LRNYGLNAIVYWRLDDLLDCNATGEISSMLELELVERMHGNAQSLHTIGDKLLIVQRHTVLLIKNMPEDEVKRGNLQDNLQIILEGINAKLEYFHSQHMRQKLKEHLIDDIATNLYATLDELRLRQVSHKEQSIQLIGILGVEVEKAFFSMGLTEAQETEILNTLNHHLNLLVDQLEEGMQLDEDFTALALRLSSSVKNALL
jgi:hypothetical protein